MSRRIKRPLAKSRASGDRPRGAPPYRGSRAERPPAQRAGGKPSMRSPRDVKAPPPADQMSKAAAELPALPTKVQTVLVTADENNMRVDRFLEARFPGLSFSHIQRIIRKGELRVNGRRVAPKDRLEPDAKVRIPPLTHEPPKAAAAQAIPYARRRPSGAHATRLTASHHTAGLVDLVRVYMLTA